MKEKKKLLKCLKMEYFHFIIMKFMNKWKQKKKKKKEETKKNKKEEEEEEKKQDKKPFDPKETIEWMINKEDTHVSNELFKKHFKVETPSLMYEVLHKTNDKKKIVNQ